MLSKNDVELYGLEKKSTVELYVRVHYIWYIHRGQEKQYLQLRVLRDRRNFLEDEGYRNRHDYKRR